MNNYPTVLDKTSELPAAEELQPTMMYGSELFTNIPEGVRVFESTDHHPYSVPIIPAATDSLESGTYVLRSEDQRRPSEDDDLLLEEPINKEITIFDTENGKAIGVDVIRANIELSPEVTNIMKDLGFIFEQRINDYSGEQYDKLVAIPTPETIKKMSLALGVDVELFPEDSLISPQSYVRAFSEGKYPIASGSETYFIHDIQDDHITGVVLGGELLRDALVEVSSAVLSTENEEMIGHMAGRIDVFTNTLRSVIADGGTLGEAYGIESGRGTLYKSGKKVGLSADTIESILLVAQERAKSFGIETKQLK
jgi:hypothetical protein